MAQLLEEEWFWWQEVCSISLSCQSIQFIAAIRVDQTVVTFSEPLVGGGLGWFNL